MSSRRSDGENIAALAGESCYHFLLNASVPRNPSEASPKRPKPYYSTAVTLGGGQHLITTIVEVLKYLAVIMSSLCGLKKAKQKIDGWRVERNAIRNRRHHEAIASVYPILNAALNKFDEVDRVTVFRSHNGNGIPKLGQPCSTSCIQEVLTDRTTPITQRWQSIPSDALMVSCISGMMEKGHSVLRVVDGARGILADFARGNNIQSVLAAPIAYTDTGFLFVNFCSASADLSDVDGVLFEAQSVAARINTIIEAAKN